MGRVLYEPARYLFPVELASDRAQRSRLLRISLGGDRIDAAGRRRGRDFALGSIIDRFSFRALALVYFIAVFAVGAIGQFGHSVVFVTMAIFAAGFCIVGGQIAANALAAAFYPTSVRATGVGWALGIGRVGSIVGPLIGGALLTAKWSTASVFMTAAPAALCAAIAAFWLSRLAGMGGTGKSSEAPASYQAGLRPSTMAGA